MNLIEAIKSGKPFKRRSQKAKIYFTSIDDHLDGVYLVMNDHSDCLVFLNSKDILADDWEVKDE